MPTHNQHFVPLWRSRGLRWGLIVASMFAMLMLALFELVAWKATDLLFATLDRSISEQLELLAARPSAMLPFMITSRMNGGPAVVTQVGLFLPDRTSEVGDLLTIPPDLVLDGQPHESRSDDGTSILHAAGKALPDGRILVVARDATESLAVRQDFIRAGLTLAVPGVAFTIALGIAFGILSNRRLRHLNDTAEQIMGGALSLRLSADVEGDELDRLCAIFNRILARLEEGMAALRNAGENIAHDLRTPLTALRARLERAYNAAGDDTPVGRMIDDCIGNVDQSLSTITALLRIADLQNGWRSTDFQPCNLAALLEETVEIFQPVAEERQISLSAVIEAHAYVDGEWDLLVEAVANLVDNALKFTPPGGHVGVFLRSRLEGPVISVADSGPGIPAEARESVLRRFVKLDISRNSTGRGLGLSLVQAICDLHHFPIFILDNNPGCKIVIQCFR